MSDENREETDALGQMADELRLQAWLAAADFKNPSLHEEGTREEISALAAMRDELRLQAHLGRLEAQDELQRIEGYWRDLKHKAAHSADEVGEGVRELLRRIRAGYDTLSGEG